MCDLITFPWFAEGHGCGFKSARITIAKQPTREFIVDIENWSLYRSVYVHKPVIIVLAFLLLIPRRFADKQVE